MANNQPLEEFSPDIEAAFHEYLTPPLSGDFDARFWAQFESRRGRYRGVWRFWRRVWDIEIEGVAVWKLLVSTASGGASCVLFLLFALGLSNPKPALVAPAALSHSERPLEAPNVFALHRREWEWDWILESAPQRKSKFPSAPPRALKKEGDFSWRGFNARWA